MTLLVVNPTPNSYEVSVAGAVATVPRLEYQFTANNFSDYTPILNGDSSTPLRINLNGTQPSMVGAGIWQWRRRHALGVRVHVPGCARRASGVVFVSCALRCHRLPSPSQVRTPFPSTRTLSLSSYCKLLERPPVCS